MKTEIIERLLCLLDVRLHAPARCEVGRGARLKLPGMKPIPTRVSLRHHKEKRNERQ